MDMNAQDLVRLFVEGGLGVALVKTIMVLGEASLKIGEIAVKMESRLTILETDTKWLKQSLGKREADKQE